MPLRQVGGQRRNIEFSGSPKQYPNALPLGIRAAQAGLVL